MIRNRRFAPQNKLVAPLRQTAQFLESNASFMSLVHRKVPGVVAGALLLITALWLAGCTGPRPGMLVPSAQPTDTAQAVPAEPTVQPVASTRPAQTAAPVSVEPPATPVTSARPTATVPVGRIELTATPVVPPPEGLIAFIGPDRQLWLMGTDGRDQQKLTMNGQVLSLAWSPDGQTLAHVSSQRGNGGFRQAMLYHVDDRHEEPIGPPDESLYSLAWSPVGHYLLLDSGTGMVRSVAIIDMMTHQVIHRLAAVQYAWSPDGKRLAFGQPRPLETPIPIESGDSVSLAVLEIGQQGPRVVFEGSAKVFYILHAWLPDGRLFYERLDWDENTRQDTGSLWTVMIDNTVGEPQPAMNIPPQFDREAVLARLPQEFQNPATGSFSWSPDGRWLVFHAGKGPQMGIYLLDWDEGKQPLYLTEGTWPAWQSAPTKP